MRLVLVLGIFICTLATLCAEEKQHLVINNRVLAQVHGKTISTADVIKKMNVFLQRNYPDALRSTSARHQFYTTQWKQTLQQMIDQQLILADAEEKSFSIDDATVREEMMKRFGPNVMLTLEKLGISYEEMRAMLTTELTVQQMIGYRVHNKALQTVHPQDVKAAYKRYCSQNPSLDKCTYQVLSIRAETPEIGQQLAEKASTLLREENADFASVAEKLKEEVPPEAVLNVSQDYETSLQALSPEHRAILSELEPSSYSLPAAQLSRIGNTLVHRIFYLKDKAHMPTSPFAEMQSNLRDGLLDEMVAHHTTIYLEKLRKRFGYDILNPTSDIPTDFSPCSLITLNP